LLIQISLMICCQHFTHDIYISTQTTMFHYSTFNIIHNTKTIFLYNFCFTSLNMKFKFFNCKCCNKRLFHFKLHPWRYVCIVYYIIYTSLFRVSMDMKQEIPRIIISVLISTLLFGAVENACSSCMCQNNLFPSVALT